MKNKREIIGIFLICAILVLLKSIMPQIKNLEVQKALSKIEVVNGEYKPFNVPRKTMEKLMELVETEDVDYIYEVFSPAVRENTEGLYEQIVLFINQHFCIYS